MSSFLSASPKWIIFGLLLAGLPASAWADANAIRNSDNAVWGAVGGSYLNYAETGDAGTTLDTERGWMPAIAGGVSYLSDGSKLPPNLYLAFDGQGSFGDVHYKGSLMNGTPYQGNTDENIFSINGRAGLGMPLGSDVMLIPYGEIGYRFWDRDLGGYTEDYHNYDVMAGLMAQYAPTQKLVLSLSGSGGTTFGGGMTASNPTMHFDLGSDAIWKLEGKVGYALTPRMEIFTSLDYLQFNYGRSQNVLNPVNGFYYYEPNSETQQLTSMVGLAYHFQ